MPQVTINLTDDEKRIMERKARQRGTSMSRFLRERVLVDSSFSPQKEKVKR